jgi:hypothetical protein
MNRMQNPFLRVRIGLVALALVLVAGTAGYQLFGFSLLDAVYQSVITVSTVGFNAPHALDAGSKVFTIILILVVAPECGSCCQSSRCWPRSGARSHGRLIAWAAVTSSSGIASCSSRDDATEPARTCRIVHPLTETVSHRTGPQTLSVANTACVGASRALVIRQLKVALASR